MKTGLLQRQWSKEKPETFNKETLMVCFDIKRETRADEEGESVEGFSYVQVQIDNHIDYAHIKSQLIESGFAQKDEFGLLMNSVNDILVAAKEAQDFAAFKNALNTTDLNEFRDFCDFRKICADAAREVVDSYFMIS